MPDSLKRVGTFAAGRYNALRDGSTHSRALGYMAILNQVRDFELSSADPECDLLDWLSKPQTDPNLARACKEVLEHIGASP